MEVRREAFGKAPSPQQEKLIALRYCVARCMKVPASFCAMPYINDDQYVPENISLHVDHGQRFKRINLDSCQMLSSFSCLIFSPTGLAQSNHCPTLMLRESIIETILVHLDLLPNPIRLN